MNAAEHFARDFRFNLMRRMLADLVTQNEGFRAAVELEASTISSDDHSHRMCILCLKNKALAANNANLWALTRGMQDLTADDEESVTYFLEALAEEDARQKGQAIALGAYIALIEENPEGWTQLPLDND